jgi:hypothetical protein
MSVRSLQDQVSDLLTRQVVEDRSRGAINSDIEAAALVESIAIRLLMLPRSALYLAYLARNGLLSAISTELEVIDTLSRDIEDLGNVSFAVKDLRALQTAQIAILQIGEQGSVGANSSALARFSSSVDEFLNKQLAKNIRQPGATDLVRPSVEAAQDLPGTMSLLKDAHDDLLDRLYSLAVGVENFTNTPLATIVGFSTIARIKNDVQGMIEEFQTDDSGTTSRDAAIRLFGSRATLDLLANPPSIFDPRIATDENVPPGRVISARTPNIQAVATSISGPFTIGDGGDSLTIDVNGTAVSTTAASLLQSLDRAAIVGDQVSWPVSIPANTHLFLTLTTQHNYGTDWTFIGDRYYRTFKVTLNDGTAPTTKSLAQVIAAFASSSISGFVTPVEFLHSGTGRLLLHAAHPTLSISISESCVEIDPNVTGVGNSRFYNLSAHSLLGFKSNQIGTVGLTSDLLTQCLNYVFGSLILAESGPFNIVTVSTVTSAFGTKMSISGVLAGELGLVGDYLTTSNQVFLYENGEAINPFDLVGPGDELQGPSGTATVIESSSTDITLDRSLPTFSGSVVVVSVVSRLWGELDYNLRKFIPSWTNGRFHSDLSVLDRVVAVLVGSPTAPNRASAQAMLSALRSEILQMQSAITTSVSIPTGGAQPEKAVINDVISFLTERKYDRAVDFLLRCRIQEIFELDWQTLSYGGNLMRTAENLARTDIIFPNYAKDEANVSTTVQHRKQ